MFRFCLLHGACGTSVGPALAAPTRWADSRFADPPFL